MRNLLLIAILILTATASFPADRITLTGKVTDKLGKPLEDAIVMVYAGGVKKGYSTYCPTCYVDCGKRTVTDRTGSFTIKSLNPDLLFDLLVIRDGYVATFVKKVDPSRGPIETAALSPRAPVDNPGRVVRGRVVDTKGQPLRAAVVAPLGVTEISERGPVSSYGTIPGLEPVAVTSREGEFELANSKLAKAILLKVEARGMATKLIALPTGAERKTITLSDGAVIRGRLVNHGNPVGGAEVGIIARNRGGFFDNLKIIGNPYEEIRIGTQEDGSFVVTNVPVPVDWYVYSKMESVTAFGAAEPVECTTARDGQEIDVGDIQIHAGHRLRGRVTLSDGAAMADGMRVTISSSRAFDSQTTIIGRDGSFEFTNLPTGPYEIFTSVRSYRLDPNKLKKYQEALETTIDRDIDDFAITLEREPRR